MILLITVFLFTARQYLFWFYTHNRNSQTIRKQFLKEHRPIRYQNLLLSGKLTAHLNQIDQEVTEQVEVLMKQMAEKQSVNENLKRQDQMRWVRLMNNIKVCAEEIVLTEIIYV